MAVLICRGGTESVLEASTAVVFAHRPETTAIADRIFDMPQAKLRTMATGKEMLNAIS